MKSFANRFAIVSGAGSGMSRELVRQLARAGASSAFCDVNKKSIQETIDLVKKESPNVKVTGHVADVAKDEDWQRFRSEALKEHGRDSVSFECPPNLNSCFEADEIF